MIQRYQQAELSLIAKYKYRTYNKVYFRGGSNNNLNLITCEDNIFIPSKFQSCVIHWYHTYIHHPVIDIMEVMICQHLYWPGIINVVRKEVTNGDTC